jgi:hypothetical protein
MFKTYDMRQYLPDHESHPALILWKRSRECNARIIVRQVIQSGNVARLYRAAAEVLNAVPDNAETRLAKRELVEAMLSLKQECDNV